MFNDDMHDMLTSYYSDIDLHVTDMTHDIEPMDAWPDISMDGNPLDKKILGHITPRFITTNMGIWWSIQVRGGYLCGFLPCMKKMRMIGHDGSTCIHLVSVVCTINEENSRDKRRDPS